MNNAYFSPELDVVYVNTEESIATGSATATFIGSSSTDYLDVDSWNGTANDGTDSPFVTHTENW